MSEKQPLFADAFVGEPPAKRAVAYVLKRREQGHHVAGVYCGYAPLELLHSMNITPAVLCAFANATIEEAEGVLPANLCPLIKSSYGFILKDTCPFFSLSEAVIAETTCDGKKKMFELIADRRPLHVMDLPQLPDEPEALDNWTVMLRKLAGFLEKTFDAPAPTAAELEAAILENNRKNQLVTQLLEFNALEQPVLSWQEMHDIIFVATPARGQDINPVLEQALKVVEARVRSGYRHGKEDAPRVLISGCPVGGDAAKVFRIIEEAGGVIVAIDSCMGLKTFAETVDEGTADPMRAIADRYLKVPCACMTPNTRRLDVTDRLIARYQPNVVIDIVLQACHGYNIESAKVARQVEEKHGRPFLKIVTDYSPGDIGQIKTRVEALFESIR